MQEVSDEFTPIHFLHVFSFACTTQILGQKSCRISIQMKASKNWQ